MTLVTELCFEIKFSLSFSDADFLLCSLSCVVDRRGMGVPEFY